MSRSIVNIGTVVGNTSPQEFRFNLRSFAAKLGDLVTVEIDIPSDDPTDTRDKVLVWGRITELQRFNPFLPAEAGVELADEGLDLLDTVLSTSRDQIEGTVLVLGRTEKGNFRKQTGGIFCPTFVIFSFSRTRFRTSSASGRAIWVGTPS